MDESYSAVRSSGLVCFCRILQNKIQDIFLSFELSTPGSERVKRVRIYSYREMVLRSFLLLFSILHQFGFHVHLLYISVTNQRHFLMAYTLLVKIFYIRVAGGRIQNGGFFLFFFCFFDALMIFTKTEASSTITPS